MHTRVCYKDNNNQFSISIHTDIYIYVYIKSVYNITYIIFIMHILV